MNIAIISPSQNSYSETFIQQHKKINGRIFYYYGGNIPNYLEGFGKIKLKLLSSLFYSINKRIGVKSAFSYQEQALIDDFNKNKIQVVLAEYGPTAVAVLKTCKFLKIPLVVHFHGFDACETATIEKFGKKYKEVFIYAKAVVVVSKKMISDLISLGCPKEKIHLSPCGPSTDFFQVNPKAFKNQFVAVGRFVEKKAPHLTLAAFKIVTEKYPDTNLVMIGSGDLLPICKQLAKLWEINNNVQFCGILSPDKIKETLSQSIAFVQHSVVASNGDSEGTPVAVLEASAASLPVIATKHAGINDVIIHGKTGFLVEEFDEKKMATYMIELIEKPELAREMGELGRENIKANFSLKKNLTELEHILTRAAF